MSRRITILVSLRLPEGASFQAAQQYVEDAVRGWHGGMDPDHPMYNLDPKAVRTERQMYGDDE